MSTQQDASIGFKEESVYGTAVTVDSFAEFNSETFDWTPTFSDPATAHRVGRRLGAADRRVLTSESVGGSFTTPLFSKGLGKLFDAALGTSASNVASGAAYQQLFTQTSDDYLPSFTIQKGIPLLGGSATIATQTYTGMVCNGFDLSVPNQGEPSIAWNWIGKAVDLATAYATPSYISSNSLLSFVHGSITIGGSVTVPTTTALATGGTAVANVESIDLSYANNLDTGGHNLGAAGRLSRSPARGLPTVSGSMTIEYDSNTIRDAYKAQTDLALVLTFALTTAITGSYYPTIQFTIPVIRLDGELAKVGSGSEPVKQTIPFTGLDGRTAANPFYVAIVTTETAV